MKKIVWFVILKVAEIVGVIIVLGWTYWWLSQFMGFDTFGERMGFAFVALPVLTLCAVIGIWAAYFGILRLIKKNLEWVERLSRGR